ncbi:MAG: 50S ribosomal protein L15 [Balneola sp.]|jgi:large subunit ribosomal protein L15|nr:50S ribosomal protein L15 [Balneola sp.]MBR9918945.1 50S ribosomal protein L15 [bacterium]MBO6623188.1 50S ribosomal protein L15 [Balneola sp.]MBO6652258.1 50S ribosomal protein L15 [Balneola sp.]MBO6712894.1 50S ribosomal protein L15 [Balneola sp.]
MDLHNLKAPAPNNKNRKRVGRGEGSGHGEQSGRGHNGQKSRSGFKRRPWFEGGQMPLQRRIPKFGFTNPNRSESRPLNVQTVGEFIEAGKLGTTITISDLVAAGLAHKNDHIKLLGRGEISTKVEIEVHAASKSAVELIEKAGGKVNVI